MKPHIPGRLHAQGLDAPRFEAATEVVRHLGCVQSQLHDMALWAVARRTTGLTLADLQGSFDRGDFVRTHVLRPTWHFVDPADIGWLLALTAPRVSRLMASTASGTDLTEAHLDRGAEVVVAALSEGSPLLRSELADHLAGAGLPSHGQSLAHIVMHAEINALIVNGPMRGKQHTYALLAPPPPAPPRDEMLAEVARRYGRGHGSFRAKDLAWWTSLTLTDSRRAIELSGLETHDLDGEPYAIVPAPDGHVPGVMLLSAFDEYISYVRDPLDLDEFADTTGDIMRGTGLLMIDGRLAGLWSRSITTRAVTLRIETSHRLTAALRRGIDDEAAAFARFLDREPVVELVA